MPTGRNESLLYRLVLEHGGFGIHNMSITVDTAGQPQIMSFYDWETGNIVPAILANPEIALWIDFVIDEDGAPSIKWVPKLHWLYT